MTAAAKTAFTLWSMASQLADEEVQMHGHSARQLTEDEQQLLKRDTEVLSDFKRNKLEKDAKKNWDLFYKRNTTLFSRTGTG